ncbi:alpha-galactosidase [Botryobacter ruber]|uniref:alpha-galactosidase n=1 Tax=Botryobacter ruber TaxID=2171629 RepID=UPI000E0B71E5|nr:alpha-galactosidase [Botryobacter ruber]
MHKNTSPFLGLLMLLFSLPLLAQQQEKQVLIETKNTALILTVGSNQRLYQSYFGEKLSDHSDYSHLMATRHEAYVPAGMENLFEPAIRVTHADGNPSLELKHVNTTVKKQDENVTTTSITLKDPKYPMEVVLHYVAHFNEDIFKTWTEIKHQEKKPVTLHNFASSMMHFDASSYWLSQFDGDYMIEMGMKESQLTNGIKTLDSKLGTRAHMYRTPVFFLSTGGKSTETTGNVVAGTLAWSGNFQISFEIDQANSLRVLSGMNPYNSEYQLEKGKTFTTPPFIFTYSGQGKGQASRNLHKWARKYGVLDGDKPRLTLLNNWEATHMDFDEKQLVELFDGAKKLGVDLFLLDDGWFGEKFPRDNDRTALGDWMTDKKKLPSGIGYLVSQAHAKDIKFGIWLEPEMVSPKSALYEKHPEWILKLPNREEHYSRHQLVLDLTNPKVQDFVYKTVDDLMTQNPGISFIKWDCNRMMTNAFSPYLKDKQSHLYIDYTRSLYAVMERLRNKYPHLPIMLCAGGGGRTDYGALQYFSEFWPSDNTNGFERVFIQWGYLNFFPSVTVSSHVTSMGKQPIKFRTDVAMMGKMGYDIKVSSMTPQEIEFSREAVKTYKKLSPVIWTGDLFRLVSPYEENRAVLMYTSEDKNKAVLFNYILNTRHKEKLAPVKLQGLDPAKRYIVQEVNMLPGTQSQNPAHGKTYSGEYLMKVGMNLSPGRLTPVTSNIFEITEEKHLSEK